MVRCRDVQQCAVQAGATGKQQNGHNQTLLLSRSRRSQARVCLSTPSHANKEILNSNLHPLTTESIHTFDNSDQKKQWNTRKKDSPSPSWGLILVCLILGWYQPDFTHAIVVDFNIQVGTGTAIWEPPLRSRDPYFQNWAPGKKQKKAADRSTKDDTHLPQYLPT